MKKKLIIIGLGPHAQSFQYKFLENLYSSGISLQVLLLAELSERENNLREYLSNTELQPEEVVLLPQEDRNDQHIHPALLEHLERIKHLADGMLICTEPKAHKKYILWALQNNIDVLTDKPLTAPLINEVGPKQVWNDFVEIKQALSNSKAKLCLMTNKRLHRGYQAVYEYAYPLCKKYGVPITHIGILEGGGVWPFPCEFEKRENHPYKYGYGVLLHTGFHYVDLLSHYQSINHSIGYKEDDIKIQACGTTPYDVVHQLSQKIYEKIFAWEDFSQEFQDLPLEKYKRYGIVDLIAALQFLQKGAVITQGSLNLLQNTLSSRSERPMPRNPYLNMGMLTQNSISLSGGPFFYIHLSYFQPACSPMEWENKYVLEIYKNTKLISGTPMERIEFDNVIEDGYGGWVSLNGESKIEILKQWIKGDCPSTHFSLHEHSVYLTSQIFEKIFEYKEKRWGKM